MSGASKSAPALEARLSVVVGSGKEAFTVEAELSLREGVLVLFGPSGAGKSLTIQALGGLIRPKRGFLRVAGEALFDAERGLFVPPEARHIGYVPQLHTLFPFASVWENVVFGLSRKERRRDNPRALALLDELGLRELIEARPSSLSGGERQRVALARALAVEPRLLLLDEPLASIDQEGRAVLRRLLREVIERRKVPAVLVTHDPEEALAMGDRLVRFERGRTVGAGPVAEMLARREVVVQGRAAGAARSTGEGRAEVVLREVRVEGPSELLEGAGEEVRLVLQEAGKGRGEG